MKFIPAGSIVAVVYVCLESGTQIARQPNVVEHVPVVEGVDALVPPDVLPGDVLISFKDLPGDFSQVLADEGGLSLDMASISPVLRPYLAAARSGARRQDPAISWDPLLFVNLLHN